MRKILPLPFLIGVLAVFSCSPKKSQIEQKDNPIFVNTFRISYHNNMNNKRFVGVVQEEMAASISFPLNGKIEQLYVNEGQYIKKGTLLAQLNPYSLENAHKASVATLKQAEDAMKRIQLLYDNKSLPEIQYIEMLTNLEKARSAEAIAQKNLNDSQLYAPFNGMVGRISMEMGENVLPNQTVLSLLNIKEVAIKIAVPENEVNQIPVGQVASIRISAANNQLFEGKVFEKGIVADPISHTYPLLIKVKNQHNTLLPGMVSEVSISSAENNEVISIPNRCILKDGKGQTYVWKVVNNVVHKQIIQTGNQKTTGVEITNGLLLGDEVITDGYQKVSNGVKVSVL